MRYGRWWAIQRNAGLSLGVHVELRSLLTNGGITYGPYIDFHVIQFVISIGVNPIYAGELELLQSYARGGLSAGAH